jgi:cytochrome c oxidase subunit 4
MDTVETQDRQDVELHPDPHASHEKEHPGELLYFKVAAFLFIVTALEVSTYYIDFGKLAIPMLIVMMSIKFGVVAAFFMHLKFDSPIFTRVFVAGLALAAGVYIVALATFAFWM